jgi:hypothetical protein
LRTAHPDIKFVCDDDRIGDSTFAPITAVQNLANQSIGNATMISYSKLLQIPAYIFDGVKFKRRDGLVTGSIVYDPKSWFIKRSDLGSWAPKRNTTLTNEQRTEYFNAITKTYLEDFSRTGGKRSSRRQSKRKNKSTKRTTRRRSTRKRANKKR